MKVLHARNISEMQTYTGWAKKPDLFEL